MRDTYFGIDPVLKNILYSFTIRYATMGYTQGLNSIAVMLSSCLDEREAFWSLVGLVDRVLPPDFFSLQREFPVLIAATQALATKHGLCSDMTAACGENAVSTAMDLMCTKWFVKLFVDELPLEASNLVWDRLADTAVGTRCGPEVPADVRRNGKGSLCLVTVALACFRLVPEDLLPESDSEELMMNDVMAVWHFE